MVSIRPFEEKDNTSILAMEKLCPQGNEKYAMGADKSPNAAARYDLYDNSKFLVAEDEGKVVGSIGCTLKKSLSEYSYVYITEVNVHPDFRKLGIASQLIKEVEKYASDNGADHIYCYIFEPNNASKSLFTELGYSNPLDIQACAISVYKKVKIPETYRLEKLKRNEISEVLGIINEYYKDREHFLPYSTKEFEKYVNNIPNYGLENFWVVKDNGEIVACAGLWDGSNIAKTCFTKEPFSWKVMKRIFGFLGIFAKMPYFPAENEYFNLHMVVDHAFKVGNSDAILSLMGHFNNMLLESNEYFFLINLDPNDILLEKLEGLRPQIDKWSVYNKSLSKDLKDISQIYVDIRDMIL